MEEAGFVDYYELLGLSPNASSETIERVFRFLARRYHPDNQETADRDRFDLLLEAHKVLRDPAKRVEYDLAFRKHAGVRSELIELAGDVGVVDRDMDIQSKLLSLFYAKRKRDLREPGIPDAELERLTGYPIELLEFNLWYMREKKWIVKTETGMFAITADGVDRAAEESQLKTSKKLLTDQTDAAE